MFTSNASIQILIEQINPDKKNKFGNNLVLVLKLTPTQTSLTEFLIANRFPR